MLKALIFLLIVLALSSLVSYSYYSNLSFKVGYSPPNKVILEIYSVVNNPVNISFNNITQEIYIRTTYNLTGVNISLVHTVIPNCPKSKCCYIINNEYLMYYNSTFLILIMNNSKEIGYIKIIVCKPENLTTPSLTNLNDNGTLPSKAKDGSSIYDYIIVLLIPILSVTVSILLRVIKRNK
ncbi:hypothetical protein Ahos_0723 [Acidianus hospitalis W1]|uniref:Uncharacterized protein n=1 Tax=Acidianus hospitalis (strain W1) TaxID=933801 RepID=F4B7K5_ACIHW|nr:hypothetical protein Ahos_0723 [Acidianus hospitalis W1]